MRFNGLDLNLLVALDALITERSVSEAAARIGLTQSAMSSALGRLREYFGDNLLVNVGRRMVLTPRGEALAGPVHDTLLQISTMIARPPEFEPAQSTRGFNIIASDYMIRVALGKVLARVSAEAPHISFVISALDDQPAARLERAEVDLLITAEPYLSDGHPFAVLFEEDYVVVAWEGNKRFAQGPLDAEAYKAMAHVVVNHGRSRVPTFETAYVKSVGGQRRVEVVAPAFTDVGDLLIGTQRISTVHRRLARLICAEGPLVMHELPFTIPTLRLAVQWHHINRNDQELRWLLDILIEECATA